MRPLKWLVFAIFIINCSVASSADLKWQDLKSVKINKGSSKPSLSSELALKLRKKVSITGYMMPLDWNKNKVSQFLLLPYYPACMHVPMPPANQTILVFAKKDIKISYKPVTVTGQLSFMYNQKEALFSMSATSIK